MPISGDITVRTIEMLDFENLGIVVGILFIGATELEIHVGSNFTSPLDIQRCKKILDTERHCL